MKITREVTIDATPEELVTLIERSSESLVRGITALNLLWLNRRREAAKPTSTPTPAPVDAANDAPNGWPPCPWCDEDEADEGAFDKQGIDEREAKAVYPGGIEGQYMWDTAGLDRLVNDIRSGKLDLNSKAKPRPKPWRDLDDCQGERPLTDEDFGHE